jgi:hypothetical protein
MVLLDGQNLTIELEGEVQKLGFTQLGLLRQIRKRKQKRRRLI